jgi:hypothetical protein
MEVYQIEGALAKNRSDADVMLHRDLIQDVE